MSLNAWGQPSKVKAGKGESGDRVGWMETSVRGEQELKGGLQGCS